MVVFVLSDEVSEEVELRRGLFDFGLFGGLLVLFVEGVVQQELIFQDHLRRDNGLCICVFLMRLEENRIGVHTSLSAFCLVSHGISIELDLSFFFQDKLLSLH